MIRKALLYSVFFLLLACTKERFNQQNTTVPWTRVNFVINNIAFTSTPSDFIIQRGQGHNGNGIIVFNLDNSTFFAFDLTCPYVDPSLCKLPMNVDSKTGEMTCNDCGNDEISFTQFNTRVTIEDTIYNLRQYRASLEGNVLRITNF